MEFEHKSVIAISVIIILLFIGGLYYIFSESTNRKVALDLVQMYIYSKDPVQKAELAVEIKKRIDKPPLALTSRASFDSFDVLIQNALKCQAHVKTLKLDPANKEASYNTAWVNCMNHPDILDNK